MKKLKIILTLIRCNCVLPFYCSVYYGKTAVPNSLTPIIQKPTISSNFSSNSFNSTNSNNFNYSNNNVNASIAQPKQNSSDKTIKKLWESSMYSNTIKKHSNYLYNSTPKPFTPWNSTCNASKKTEFCKGSEILQKYTTNSSNSLVSQSQHNLSTQVQKLQNQQVQNQQPENQNSENHQEKFSTENIGSTLPVPMPRSTKNQLKSSESSPCQQFLKKSVEKVSF